MTSSSLATPPPDQRRYDLESYISSLQDTTAQSGGRSPDRWRRLSLLRAGDVEPNPGPPRVRSRGGLLLIADGTATKYRRALDDFDVFFAVRDGGSCSSLSSRLGSSSLSRLLQGIGSGASVQASSLLALRELWSLLCDDLFCSRSPSARKFLIPLFTSAPCGDYINPGSWRFRQSSGPLWTSSTPSPPPCSPPSQEKLRPGEWPCGTTFRSSTSRKLPGTSTFFEF